MKREDDRGSAAAQETPCAQDGLLIRPARTADAREICALIKSHNEQLIVRSLGNVLKNIDRFLVAEIPGVGIAGTLAYELWPEFGDEKSTSAELQSVCVRESCRGRGVGHALVDAQLARLRALGVAQAVVLTFAVDFFAGIGFREIEKKAVMYKLYTGCINCSKHENPFTCPEHAMALQLS